jgi:hypothetical protein
VTAFSIKPGRLIFLSQVHWSNLTFFSTALLNPYQPASLFSTSDEIAASVSPLVINPHLDAHFIF